MKKIMSVVLALVLVSVFSVSAMAAKSVTAPIVKDYEGGTGTYEQDASGDEYTFTAEPKDGYNFIGWEIDGNYEIIDGDLDSETITVQFLDGTTLEDVSAEPIFEKTEEDEEPDTGDEVDDTSDTKSPKNGDSVAMSMLAIAALGGVIVSKKKLSK